MHYTKIISIDPGLSGGIVVYSMSNKSIYCGDMPVFVERKNGKKIRHTDVSAIANILEEHRDVHSVLIIIERVLARPQDADHPGKIFRIQKMLSNYYSLITVIKLSGIDYIEVFPRVWQGALNLSKDKNANKAFAKSNYPMIENITLKISDAICLLHFCRLKLKTNPKWIKDRFNNSSNK